MADILTALQIACMILLAIGGPAYAVLRLYWRAEAAEEQLRNERLKTSRLQREVQRLQKALTTAQRGEESVVTVTTDSSSQLSDTGPAGAD